MKIIILVGFINAGKSTLSDILESEHNYTKISFGEILKDIISLLFSYDRKLMEGDTIESREFRETIDKEWSEKLDIPNLTPRMMLQKIGTDLFRNHFHKDIWTLILEKKIQNLKCDKIVVTDCRFTNEIKMLKKIGGKVVHIHRELPKWFIDFKNNEIEIPIDLHQSETDWIKNDFEYNIDNTGSLEDLKIECKKIL